MGVLNSSRKAMKGFIEKSYSMGQLHGEMKKINDPRRQNLIETVHLTKAEENKIDTLFVSTYGKKIKYDWHRLYQSFTGKFDENYFPEYLFSSVLEPKMNPMDYRYVLDDKLLLPLFCVGVDHVRTPRTYYSVCDGICFDEEKNIVDSVYMPYAPVDILIWPISVIVYYNYSYYYDITKIAQNKAIWFFFAMCAIAVPLIKIHLSGAGNIGQVIFLTYFCITTLPLVLILTNNRSYRNLSMVLAVLISTASTKRAGTLALILGLFIMLVVEAHIQGTLNQRWKKYLKIMLLILMGTIIVFYLENAGRIQILDRFARLGDDGGSGRDVIWSIVLNAYHSSGLVQRLFGHGFQSVYYILRPGGFYRFAHNSYIEYLYDYGTVGLILLLVFIIALIVSTIDMVRRKARFAPVMCLLLAISVFLGMFSYFFEESNIIMPVAVAYGVILGLDKKEKNIKDEI